ncbi:5'-3' exoribonuclease 1 [Orussus abietinus]|uniref:5'-3' exoribonuclease 1 n=1 Tax=Orussus abietinus TaxID=222816 RepID=UPI00062620CC|nr:5'-3' exoribonuclease 1 [Orussus abietinus]
MGIPKFFRYISERYPCLSESVKQHQIPEYDNLYLDMNGIIHVCSHPNDEDTHFRITEEEILKNIFHYVETLFNIIQPRKVFFMAVDGVAPRAKINQQRGRRFRSAKEAEILEMKAKAKGEVLPTAARFDSNCITPGTLFMAKLNEQLKYFITWKMSQDKLWQKCKVIFSGSEVPGEGEHKIMDYIRYIRIQPDYDHNTRHCLYGLDADLIMLGLCTHEPHFSLLREEIKFGKQSKNKRIMIPEEIKFNLLHLSIMREYLEHEFSPLKDKLPFPYNIEKIIDDWILMGFLVGNDFIPHLPNLHIVNGMLPVLYHAYMEVLPTLDGYINETGTLKLDRFEKFMEKLSTIDAQQFAEYSADLKYIESKMRKANESEDLNFKKSKNSPEKTPSPKIVLNRDLNALIKSTEDMLLGHSDEDDEDEDSDRDIHKLEFVQHKRDYYMNKLEYENVDEDVLQSQAEGYVRAIQWNLHYYYDGCCSWSWYYPHHYAPYASDIKGFKNLKLEFDLGEPFLPFQQLLAVLPAASKSLLPEPFQELLTEEQSPIINYYPKEFKTDLNGKQQEWEAVVLIPFINEQNLLKAMEPYISRLSPEELKRNQHGPMHIYVYTDEDLGFYNAPAYFPSVKNHAQVQVIKREDILVPIDKIIKGILPGAKLSVYFPGFPTLQHIKHTMSFEKSKVRVFDHMSRNDNMILTIVKRNTPSLTEVAKEFLGQTIFVQWPHLIEARVEAVSDGTLKLHSDPNNPEKEELKGGVNTKWNFDWREIKETYFTRRGIDVGETHILVHARPIIGRSYIFSAQGKLTFEKQWSEIIMSYAYQAVVKDIAVHDPTFIMYKSVADVFPEKSTCFMLGHPHYGAMGEVIEPGVNAKAGRVKVAMRIMPEPNFNSIRKLLRDSKSQFVLANIAAQRLGISSRVFGRITGSIFVSQNTTQTPSMENARHNVGLNLKFNKKNEEVPGYTRKENNQWLYSAKSIELIRNYMVQCPDLFERLGQNSVNDIFHESELFPSGSTGLNDAVSWLKSQPFNSIGTRSCGSESLEVDLVKELEKTIDEYVATQNNAGKTLLMQVKPHLLFKSGLHIGNLSPDPKAQHELCDRIVCVRESYTVPLGYKGTIMTVHKAEKPCDVMYEVLFDHPFPGALALNGLTSKRCYKLMPMDFINISYGMRVEQGRSPKSEPVLSWRQSSTSQTPPSSSAFASISGNQVAFSPAFFMRNRSSPASQPMNPRIINEQLTQIDPRRKTNEKPVEAKAILSKTFQPSKQQQPYQQNIPKTTPQQSSEFQTLWNELHKLQKWNGKPKVSASTPKETEVKQPTNTSVDTESNPRDPSAYLKVMLKIPDETSQCSLRPQSAVPPAKPPVLPQPPKSSEAPPLVQRLFDHARQTGNKEDGVLYCTLLLDYFQMNGLGVPRYTYVTCKEKNLIQAQIVLPDMRRFSGDFHVTSEQAAESVAKKVCKTLYFNKVPKPNANVLLAPPQKWFEGQPMGNRPPNVRQQMMRMCPPQMPMNPLSPSMPVPRWNAKNQQAQGFPPMMSQPRMQQRHYSPVQNTSTNWKTESNTPPVKNTSFVPLQAQKKNRSTSQPASKEARDQSKNGKGQNVHAEHRKATSDPPKKVSAQEASDIATKEPATQISSSQPQHNRQTSRMERQRKSRIAANFGSSPSPNGGEQQ